MLFKTIQILPIECLICVKQNARFWGYRDEWAISTLKAHGSFVEKRKSYATNSNIVWCDKCYIRSMIKNNVSTDGVINSVEEEGQAILWVCMGNAIFKSIKYTLLPDDYTWVLA